MQGSVFGRARRRRGSNVRSRVKEIMNGRDAHSSHNTSSWRRLRLQTCASHSSGTAPRKEAPLQFPGLLVGTETGDDAAVWRINDDTCIIATTDFFMPMVDDPFDFGRIAAANALSDIYAMGGKPLMALAILGMPLSKLSIEDVREILRGGDFVCADAGIPVAGGHSIDCPEPVYGLAAIGSCRPEQIRRNSGARVGDALILTKSIGVGVYSAAFKKGALSEDQYAEMMTSMTRLNTVGADLGKDADVHAMTDVTGFGVLGHALEMARGSGLRLVIDDGSVPLLSASGQLLKDGFVTGASGRNWDSYGASVVLPRDFPLWRRNLLTDPPNIWRPLDSLRAGPGPGT
jgi:selenide, water dikinase